MRTQHAHEQGQDHGHRHDDAHHHGHDHGPDHTHAHEHNHEHAHGTALTVRALSGLSGDMMLSGLAALAGLENGALDSLVKELKLPALDGGLTLLPHAVNQISGVRCSVTLPREHAHRSLADIAAIVQASAMPQAAQDAAMRAFRLLAEAEAAVHGKTADQVTFHEVGALDSIVDTCLVCRLFTMLAPARFVCSPLPLADGGIVCAHGHIPAPAPAVLRMLEGVPVNAFQGRGETVTPTALSLLKALGAEFGPWPAMTISKTVISYGDTVFHDAPNGAIWALGPCYNSSHFTAPSS